jgi:dTDP-4-amino-4,6-dideoxygalactose transaminase
MPRTPDDELAVEGGEPVRMDPWPTYDKGDVFIAPDDERAAVEALHEKRLFRYDDRPYEETFAGRFEQAIGEFFGVKHVLACTSGTTAIALSLMALDLPRGSAVACPAFTFAATPSAIILAGHRPVLVEADEDLHMDVDHLRKVLAGGDVKAVVVVHMRGFGSDMPAIMAVAEEAGVPVIEDAVPALGAKLHGRHLGTYGLFGAFSTQSDKSLNTGEGGFLITDDSEAYSRAVVLSGAYEGRCRRHFETAGCDCPEIDDLELPIFGFRMDEIRAALATSLLERLPERLFLHRRNYTYVASRLSGMDGIRLRRPVADGAFLGEALVFRLPGADTARAAWFAEALRAEGIDARAPADPGDRNVRAFWNWKFLDDEPEVLQHALPETRRYLCEAVDIPLSANLEREDCDQLVAAIAKVLAAEPPR